MIEIDNLTLLWGAIITVIVVGVPVIAVIRRRRIVTKIMEIIKTRSRIKVVEMTRTVCPLCKEVFYHGTIQNNSIEQ